MTPHTTQTMRNHWWWREGWSVGRRFYTWHLTFDDQPDVQRFAAAYQDALAPADGLDLIPARWLHLTMQSIGFTTDITEETVTAIAAAAQRRLAALHSFGVTFTTPVVDPEAILIPVRPPDPIRQVRNELRASIEEILGAVPEATAGFTPHLSVAYSNSDGPATPYTEALAAADIPPAKALITHADLIIIHRDHRMYEWTDYAQVPLG